MYLRRKSESARRASVFVPERTAPRAQAERGCEPKRGREARARRARVAERGVRVLREERSEQPLELALRRESESEKERECVCV